MVQIVPNENDNQVEAEIDRRQQLRLKWDGSTEDEQLMELILAVWDAPLRSPNRTRDNLIRPRAIHKLILYVQDIIKNYWQDYQQETDISFERDAKFDPLAYLSQHIDEFVPTGESIERSLIGWLGCKAINRLKDKKRAYQRKLERRDIKQKPEEPKLERQDVNQKPGDPKLAGQDIKQKPEEPKLYIKVSSLDVDVHVKDESKRMAVQIPDESLTGLDLYISKLDEYFHRALREYLTTDPEGKLKACAMKPPNEQCNCFTLVDLLYLREPPLNQTKAAAALGLENHDGLRSHWKRNCLPLLKQIAIEIAQKQGTEID